VEFSVISRVFLHLLIFLQWQNIVHGILFFSFFFSKGFIGRSLPVSLHRVAFHISHTGSVVFTIMRFPLCVVAIMGVEAG
jgi:hypothetical protein